MSEDMSPPANTSNDGLLNIEWITWAAKVTGSSEPAVRLLLSFFMGYPVGFVHHLVVRKLNPIIQHTYFAACGFLICVFNYGYDSYHSLIGILVTYLLGRLLRYAPKQFVAINFVFHMGYLLIGYCFTESNDYDITWTMPHCVLVLRLIGLGFDIADGAKPYEQLSVQQKECAIPNTPSLLELTAYTLFPASFLIGPQFPFKRYQRFIRGEFHQYRGSQKEGMLRACIGIIYLTLRQIGTTMLPDSYFLTEEFKKESILTKLIKIGLWGKISLYKYISCWLLVEGALICTDFTYAGKTANGGPDWSGCSNVHLVLLETGTKMTHYVQSFNVNTNHWVAMYIYKRLKFFNNRTLSYILTLLFLAVWHGFHIGYYMTFFLEFSIVTLEREIEMIYNEVNFSKFLSKSKILRILVFILLKAYNIILMGWCLVPFTLLNFERWTQVYAALDYFGFVILAFLLFMTFSYKYVKHSYLLKRWIINKD